jgi:hypothetical protein
LPAGDGNDLGQHPVDQADVLDLDSGPGADAQQKMVQVTGVGQVEGMDQAHGDVHAGALNFEQDGIDAMQAAARGDAKEVASGHEPGARSQASAEP